VTGATAGPVTVQASTTSPSVTSNSVSFAVVPGAVTQILLEGSAQDLASGSGRTLTATLRDAAGNTVSSGPQSTLSVDFAQTGPGTGTVTGLGSVSASGGVASVDVTGETPGQVTIQASTTSPNVASNNVSFTVVAAEEPAPEA
jgi:trimeric autotransporter adhesin